MSDMERIVPFAAWIKLIEPHYYVKRKDGRGRPPTGINKMLKNIIGWKRIRYKGGAKNDSLFHMLFACANLYKLSLKGEVCPLSKMLHKNGGKRMN